MKLMSCLRAACGRRARDRAAACPFRNLYGLQQLRIELFDVTLDGKRFLLLQATGPPPAVELVQHWTAALNK